MTDFIETPRFPDDLSYGSQGGPTFSTDQIQYGNGSIYRNANWSYPRMKYDVGNKARTRTQMNTIYKLFLACLGSNTGFRFKDYADFSSASDGKATPATSDCTIGTGTGAQTAFNIVKIYTSGSTTLTRRIKKPVSGTVIAEVNGGVTTAFTVDTATGIITFTAAPANGHVVKCGYLFDVPVHFASDDLSNISWDIYTATGSDLININSILLAEI